MAQAATTLSAAIAAAGTLSCTVRDVVGFATAAETDDLVQIESEYTLVTAGMGTTSWTITRGYAGSTAVAHADATASVERAGLLTFDQSIQCSERDASILPKNLRKKFRRLIDLGRIAGYYGDRDWENAV